MKGTVIGRDIDWNPVVRMEDGSLDTMRILNGDPKGSWHPEDQKKLMHTITVIPQEIQ